MSDILFRERQHFRQPWIWLFIIPIAAIAWYGAWQQLVQGRPFGTNPAPDLVIVIMLVLAGFGIPWLFLGSRLDTEVDADGIRVRFRPFHRRWRSWSWDQIEAIEARTYSPLLEFGGWGIRLGPRGMAYNVSGRMGVELHLRTGRRVLIGTRDADGFMAAVDAAQAR